MNKYRNIKTVVNGITFDSRKEARRYTELMVLQRAKIITDLELQKRFEICPKKYENKRARYYVADFVYVENGKRVIEDVKSKSTQTPLFSLKWALMKVNYPEYEYRIYDD